MIKQLIKKQRGITLSMLLITIILISILIGVTVVNLDMGNDIKEYNYMCADIELLDSKVLMYYNENKSLPVSSNEQIDVTHISEKNPKDNGKYYELDLSKLSNVSLNLGKGNKENKDIYIINEQSYTVYYLKGVKYEGTTYHRPIKKTPGGEIIYPAIPLLPLEYQQVEYLESTGIQYIDTGVTCNTNLKIDTTYSISSFEDARSYIFGVYGASLAGGEIGYRVQYLHTSTFFVGFGDMWNNTLVAPTENKQYNIVMDKGKFILDGEEIYDATSAGYTYSETNQASIYLFARNANGTVGDLGCSRIYECKMYIGEELKRNFIPCYRKADNVAGMYDIVKDVFYPNQGTGTFITGPIKENIINPSQGNLPSLYQEVEYLESTGTQYIDTGVIPDINTGFYLDLTILDSIDSNGKRLFGTSYRNDGQWGGIFIGTYNSTQGGQMAYIEPGNFYNPSLVSNARMQITMKNLHYTTSTGADIELETGTMNPYGTMYILNVNTDIEATSYSSANLYKAQIYNGDIIVRDFIPCYRKSDNLAGLYDLVNDVFYTNVGTGEFVVGGDVESEVTPPETLLPSEYQQVEYIESTGTQYIDTGVRLNQDSVAELDFEITEAGDYNVFGSRTSATDNNIGIIFSNTHSEVDIDFQNYTANRLKLSYNMNRNIYKISNKKLQCGDTVKTITSYTEFTTPENAYIFNMSGGAPAYNPAKMKLYSCNLYNAGSVVRKFIPCYRKSDNKPGLYDLVYGKFYLNAGTGTFDVGGNV